MFSPLTVRFNIFPWLLNLLCCKVVLMCSKVERGQVNNSFFSRTGLVPPCVHNKFQEVILPKHLMANPQSFRLYCLHRLLSPGNVRQGQPVNPIHVFFLTYPWHLTKFQDYLFRFKLMFKFKGTHDFYNVQLSRFSIIRISQNATVW